MTANKGAHMPRKQPLKDRPLFVRLTPEERASLDAWAASIIDDRGRPMSTSTAVRREVLRIARGAP
jgi:hypothetical protein